MSLIKISLSPNVTINSFKETPLASQQASPCLPQQYSCSVNEEVNHMLVLETDLRAEILAHYALPGWMESFIKSLLQLSRKINVLDLLHLASLVKHQLDGLQLHV